MWLIRTFQIGRKSIKRCKTGVLTLVILSTVILAGMLTAGCMQESGSASVPSGISPGATPVQSLVTTAEQPAVIPPVHAENQTGIPGDRPGQNLSAARAGMPMGGPGLPVNGTAPQGMPINGTPIRGAPGDLPPQGGMPLNSTPPAGSSMDPNARPGSYQYG
jgi:hypothetical protein